MNERTAILCKGTMPGTLSACGATVCETDGENYFLPASDIAFEIDPPRVTCPRCGYRTRLQYERPSRVSERRQRLIESKFK